MVSDELIKPKRKYWSGVEHFQHFYKLSLSFDVEWTEWSREQLFTVGSSNKHDITCESHLDHHHHHHRHHYHDTALAINKHLLQAEFHHYTCQSSATRACMAS